MPDELPPRNRIWISMRTTHPILRKTVHCRGLTIRVQRWTPEEVHRIIVAALRAAAEEEQRKDGTPDRTRST